MPNELEKVATPPLMALLGRYKGQIEQILPRHMTPTRVLKLIVGAINRNNALLRCTPMSVVNATLTAATMGLEIRPGMAYLVPFKSECTLIVDYRGKIDLALRSGKVLDIDADIVYSKDKFRIYRDESGRKRIDHEPILFHSGDAGEHQPLKDDDRGIPIGAYAVAALKEGPPKIVFMSALDISKIRAKSRAKDDGPWVTDTMEMWKKTVIHRICKLLPQTPEMAAADDVTNREENDVRLDNVLEINAPADSDDMPIVTESRAAQEALADQKIRDLEASTKKEPEPPTEKASASTSAPSVVTFATWAAWEAAGNPVHSNIVIEGGENAGAFAWHEGENTYKASAPAPKRERPVFGKRGQ